MHHYPCHIELTGRDIKDQVIGGERMDPDVFALLVRRFGQLDAAMASGNAAVRWRHFLEPDFAVRATFVNKLPFRKSNHNFLFLIFSHTSQPPHRV